MPKALVQVNASTSWFTLPEGHLGFKACNERCNFVGFSSAHNLGLCLWMLVLDRLTQISCQQAMYEHDWSISLSCWQAGLHSGALAQSALEYGKDWPESSWKHLKLHETTIELIWILWNFLEQHHDKSRSPRFHSLLVIGGSSDLWSPGMKKLYDLFLW